MERSIRGMLNPIIIRSLAYGVSPFDMEYILLQLEKQTLGNEKELEESWTEEWTKKANRYSTYGKTAKEQGNLRSASDFYGMTARCYYACYIMNSEQIAKKREVYKKLERYYQAALSCGESRFEKVCIPMVEKKKLPGYLHLPQRGTAPYPCVIAFEGMGSCKEELEVLIRPLIERGIAVLALDQPGTGSALFDYDLKTEGRLLEIGFEHTMEYVRAHGLLDETRIGTYGLSLGGSYAYRMASNYEEIKGCATLCPTFFTMEEEENESLFISNGVWAKYQRQTGSEEAFMEEMKVLEEGSIAGNFFMVCGIEENQTETSEWLAEKVTGTLEKLLIPDQAVSVSKESTSFVMPVAEQMPWVRVKMADWMMRQLQKEQEDQ